jgi:hypothetical protein
MQDNPDLEKMTDQEMVEKIRLMKEKINDIRKST